MNSLVLYVPPRSLVHHAVNGAMCDVEAGCNISAGYAFRSHLANFMNVGFSQLCAASTFAKSISTLAQAVRVVVRVAAKPKVRGAHTMPLVSSWTIVANTKSIRNWPKVQFPAQSVDTDVLVFENKESVAFRFLGASPEPTRITCLLFNSLPKALFELFGDLWQRLFSRIHTRNMVSVRAFQSRQRLLCPPFLKFSP